MKDEKRKKPFAKKSLGQNFLIDQNSIDKIIGSLNLQADEKVIEIGPGRGALTEKLLDSGAQVVAIELDRNLIPHLQKEFAKYQNFKLFEADALKIDFEALVNPISNLQNRASAKLVANLPYNISTAILQRLIEQRKVFSELILMLQREVVERMTAQIGNSERGFLTLLVENSFIAEKLFDVPPNAFRPAPKVWSSVVRLRVRNTQTIENEELFRELISSGFAYKRKTILNNLKNASPGLHEKIGDISKFLHNCQIEPTRRAETLSLVEWHALVSKLS